MQSSNIPGKLYKPFAANAGGGFIRPIPVASQIGILAGAASLTDGFVPLNAQPIASGGVPPSIEDMNGILFEISGWSQWAAAGGPVYFDGAFATAIGGYPKGAALQSTATPGLIYVSTAENNVTNPESDGVGWVTLQPVPATLAELRAGLDTVKYATALTLAGLRSTTADLIAGTDQAKYATPEALAGLRATQADVRAGTDTSLYVTPESLAGSNTTGIIYHPGGVIQQYGMSLTPIPEGNYTGAYNTPFPISVDCMIFNPIVNTASTSDDKMVNVQWRRSSSSLSGFAFKVINPEGGITIDGYTWNAFGR